MPDPTPKTSAWTLLLVNVLGVLFALGALELLFRVTSLSSPAPSWSDRPLGYFFPNEGSSLQDKEAGEKSPGTFRVAVVGDSFTFGQRLQLADTFPKRLEGFLNLNNDASPLEVLNRGHNGYSTVRSVAVVGDAIADGADLVVLQITLNDAEPRVLTKEERERTLGAPLLDSSFFTTMSSLRFLLKRLSNEMTRQRHVEYHTKFFFDEVTYVPFQQSFVKMKRMADAHPIEFVAVLFPLFDSPFDADYPFMKSHVRIRETVQGAGIPFLDLLGAYTGVPHERLQVLPGEDSHPNEIAHRIAAEHILAFLAREQVVPKENLPRRTYADRQSRVGKPTSADRLWQLSLEFLDYPYIEGHPRK